MKQFTLDRYIHFIDIYRITYMNAVPTIMVMLSKDPSAVNYNFHSIEQAVCGSAPLGKKIGQAVQKRLFKPGVSVKQGWGMTECTCTGTAFAPDDEDDGGSVGWLMANLSAMIIPVDGEEFDNRSRDGKKIGELWISGPNVMKGYFNKPKETAETIFVDPRTKKRWLRTGDIGYFDSRGCLYIVDRLKVCCIRQSIMNTILTSGLGVDQGKGTSSSPGRNRSGAIVSPRGPGCCSRSGEEVGCLLLNHMRFTDPSSGATSNTQKDI